MTGLVAYLTLVIVVPALLLGHQGQDWPPGLWWRTVRAARARRGAQAPVSGPESPDRLPLDLRTAPRASQARTAAHAPSWADTDKEAA